MYACLCACVQTPEVYVRCLSLLVFTLFFETEFLTKPILVAWLTSKPLGLHLPTIGFPVFAATCVQGIELRSPCLHAKHITN